MHEHLVQLNLISEFNEMNELSAVENYLKANVMKSNEWGKELEKKKNYQRKS